MLLEVRDGELEGGDGVRFLVDEFAIEELFIVSWYRVDGWYLISWPRSCMIEL
jgi:hypothetical protein